MRIAPTTLKDAMRVELEPHADERGYFARTFCVNEFAEAGLCNAYVQHAASFSAKRGTLRGMHFQRAPHQEAKLVRCTAGAIYDVIIDLRPDSPTYMRWESFRLEAGTGMQLYIPPGFAHGFLTCADATEVTYLISAFHAPDFATGLRYDDPTFAITWPEPIVVINEKDRAWASFDPANI